MNMHISVTHSIHATIASFSYILLLFSASMCMLSKFIICLIHNFIVNNVNKKLKVIIDWISLESLCGRLSINWHILTMDKNSQYSVGNIAPSIKLN